MYLHEIRWKDVKYVVVHSFQTLEIFSCNIFMAQIVILRKKLKNKTITYNKKIINNNKNK